MKTFLRPFQRQRLRFASPTPPAPRPFTSAQRLQIKEDKEQNPEEIERAKKEQLKKQQEGKGEWHEELASSSESHVKADRENVKDHDKHMEDLQKETAQKHEEEHPRGKS